MDKNIIEQLADIEHQRWADWQRYMHSKCLESTVNGGNGSYVSFPSNDYRHWERQINTPYSELSEREKEEDRKQVMRYLPIIEDLLKQQDIKSQKTTLLHALESFDHFAGTKNALHDIRKDITDRINGLNDSNNDIIE